MVCLVDSIWTERRQRSVVDWRPMENALWVAIEFWWIRHHQPRMMLQNVIRLIDDCRHLALPSRDSRGQGNAFATRLAAVGDVLVCAISHDDSGTTPTRA